ncbi:MAG: NAD(P)/FAD-dependent oxidoreductase [Chitinophagales bacterium]|nr:NAD(P)/FAD-dependent oxidoreductase [Chitinophagales bacterium]
MSNHYDVIIPGGGLAGLTLSLQLKKHSPDIKILILERRKSVAPTAAHKVGESTVELGSYYLREVLGLKSYLEEHELPKHGLRFFFKSHNKADITSRVELGPRAWLPTPSHQLDRGTLENYLVEHTRSQGTEVLLDANVKDVQFGNDFHTVTYIHQGEEKTATARWVADATSRNSLLKRKLGFQKPMDHHVNAVWWRLKGVIDIDKWSNNKEWQTYLVSGLRYLSTVHFLDKGYWVWVIPLGSKNTSIGIVADPAIHPFDTIDTYEKSMEWLKVNEPLCYKMLEPETPNKMDFKILKHFAHDSGRAYDGTDRWGVTGEAGAFLDPFYSPGTDFISLSNTFLSDLILRELNGEDVQFRAEIYERTYLTLVERWIPIYRNKYNLMGNAQIMVMKIFWDWALYWSVPALLFTNNAFTDLRMLKQLFAAPDSLGQKFGKLHERMQQLFLDWLPYENQIFENRYIDPFDLHLLRDFQANIEVQHGEKLLGKIAENVSLLEKFAAEIFRHVSAQVHGTPYDLKVNPYTMSLNEATNHDLSFVAEQDEAITRDVETMWFYSKEQLV